MKRLNAVLAQLNPKLRDVEANIEKAKGILARYGEADLFVFPELFLGGYATNGVDDLALDLDGSPAGSPTRPSAWTGAGTSPAATARPTSLAKSGGLLWPGTSCW